MDRHRVQTFQDFLEILRSDPDLEIFLAPVEDLVMRYGEEFEREAVWRLQRFEEFARECGDTLDAALRFYARYVEQVALERQRFRAAPQDDLREAQAPWDWAFKRDYLYALSLSTLLNRSRYELTRDYRQVVGSRLPPGARMLEIGAGNCLDTAFMSEFAAVDSYELNDLALIWARILGLAGKVDLRIEEYCFTDEQKYDFVTMIELLEHLKDPAEYLLGAHRVLKNEGLAYLTFAVRMPQIDHLHNFLSLQECREALSDNGFAVVHEQCLIDTYMPFEESERWRLAEDPRQSLIYVCLVRKVNAEETAAFMSAFTDDL